MRFNDDSTRSNVETLSLGCDSLEEVHYLRVDGVIDADRDANASRGVDHFRRLFDRLRPAGVVVAAGIGLRATTSAGTIHRGARLAKHTCDSAPGATSCPGNQADFLIQRLHSSLLVARPGIPLNSFA
jgi:hypothetical protein